MMTHFVELKLFIQTYKPDTINISETKLDDIIDDYDVVLQGTQ